MIHEILNGRRIAKFTKRTNRTKQRRPSDCDNGAGYNGKREEHGSFHLNKEHNEMVALCYYTALVSSVTYRGIAMADRGG